MVFVAIDVDDELPSCVFAPLLEDFTNARKSTKLVNTINCRPHSRRQSIRIKQILLAADVFRV